MVAMRCSSGRRGVAPRRALTLLLLLLALLGAPALALAQTAASGTPAVAPHSGGGEASLRMPDVGSIQLMGVNGRTLLLAGLVVCVLGLLFGLVIYRLKNLPVHPSMREISELIYETCKTYLLTQGKFILILEVFIGLIIVVYFGVLLRLEPVRS